MEFTLIHHGKLPSANSADKNKKHAIREKFHPQLKRLWNQFPLNCYKEYLEYIPYEKKFMEEPNPTIDDYGDEFSVIREVKGFKFAPLICKGLGLYCEIDIKLFVTQSTTLVNNGDIDNKLKGLFDALRYPHNSDELPKYFNPPEDEQPFFCLLEDDGLIRKISVSVDQLLYPEEESDRVDLTLLFVKVKGVTSHLRNRGLIT
jgi:hypothetical protein